MCPHYGPLWAGDWRRVLFDNFTRADALTPGCPLPPKAVMLALTPPGALPVWDRETGEVICDALPWDESHCAHRGDHRHSGKDGCRVEPHQAITWNESADKRWSRLHRAAATATRRRFGNAALRQLGRAIEIQKRGVKHFHPVLLATTASQRAAVDFYRDYLARRAPYYGFGFVSEKVRPQEVKGAAAYLSSYFVTGKRGKATLQETVQHPSMRRSRLLWVNPVLTVATGVTMRELRFRRFVWVRYGSMLAMGGKWIDVARRLAEIERELGRPLTGDELAGATMGVLGTLRTTVADQGGEHAAQTA